MPASPVDAGRAPLVAAALICAITLSMTIAMLVQLVTPELGRPSLMLPFWLWGPLRALAVFGYARHRTAGARP